jgi:hypothetical protein
MMAQGAHVRLLLFLLFVGLPVPGAVKVDKVAWGGWPNCYRVSNGEVELIVTADVGPRVMRYGFVGGQNFFKEYADQLGKTGEKEFQLRGGHRVWKAPEDPVATWAPDNVPVEVRVEAAGLVSTEPVEPSTGLQKSLVIEMAPAGTEVRVTHRIANHSLFPLEYATWALTMMAPGGVAFTGFPPRGKHPQVLEATNPLVMWAYTDLSDPRWIFTSKYLGLRQDSGASSPQKIGHFNTNTWGAYVLNREVFLKQYEADRALQYPDFGCSFETFTNAEFLELETLGPLTKVQPGKSIAHMERWTLHRIPGAPVGWTDAHLDKVLLPLLR